jgi:hypothetical protein
MQDESSRAHLRQEATATLNDEAYGFPTNHKGTGETMSTQIKATVRETARDVLMVSAFGFWATILGFVPVVAIHTLFG